MLNSLLTIYNRKNRNKTPFDIDSAIKESSWSTLNRCVLSELAERVGLYGERANTDGIHLDTKDHYRRVLVEEMISNGVNPADYGYERFLEE